MVYVRPRVQATNTAYHRAAGAPATTAAGWGRARAPPTARRPAAAAARSRGELSLGGRRRGQVSGVT